MMEFLENERKELAEYFMQKAAEITFDKKDICPKSQRGVVIVRQNEIIGRGYNKITIPKYCNPCIRRHITDNSRTELCSAIHAEEMAILDALKKGNSLEDTILFHTKVKDKKQAYSKQPSCTNCSREIYIAGISEVVLWLKDGYALYSAEEFNELSFRPFVF